MVRPRIQKCNLACVHHVLITNVLKFVPVHSYERTGTSANGVELCSTRVCNAGWTCDCLGDFFCTQADIDVYTRLETSDLDLTSSVPCQITKQRTVTSAGFELGYFHPQFSDNGLLAQQCQLFVWWLDGELQDAFSDPVTVTSSNLETVKTSLSDWNNLPLRKGSVIGKPIFSLGKKLNLVLPA